MEFFFSFCGSHELVKTKKIKKKKSLRKPLIEHIDNKVEKGFENS